MKVQTDLMMVMAVWNQGKAKFGFDDEFVVDEFVVEQIADLRFVDRTVQLRLRTARNLARPAMVWNQTKMQQQQQQIRDPETKSDFDDEMFELKETKRYSKQKMKRLKKKKKKLEIRLMKSATNHQKTDFRPLPQFRRHSIFCVANSTPVHLEIFPPKLTTNGFDRSATYPSSNQKIDTATLDHHRNVWLHEHEQYIHWPATRDLHAQHLHMCESKAKDHYRHC